jgi:hypothetical protein
VYVNVKTKKRERSIIILDLKHCIAKYTKKKTWSMYSINDVRNKDVIHKVVLSISRDPRKDCIAVHTKKKTWSM